MPVVADRESVHADFRRRFGNVITRRQMFDYQEETGVYPNWLRDPEWKTEQRGVYKIPPVGAMVNTPVHVHKKHLRAARHMFDAGALPASPSAPPPALQTVIDDDVPHTEEIAPDAPVMDAAALKSLSVQDRMELLKKSVSLLARVPKKDVAFVPYGSHDDIITLIKSGRFFAAFIAGLSGCGKTYGVKQACAQLNREYVRCNITAETDEDDLLGGFRLIDGNTVFEPGPVIIAMLRGAVLLLDEIDYASPKIACMQSVLEGETITLKKLGITLDPAPGFCVFATANTKGRGDETGQFVGANLLNEAFLERFALTIEQTYPDVPTEKKILSRRYKSWGQEIKEHSALYIDTLTKWASEIRKTYDAGAAESTMSTRRLEHILMMYATFGADEAGVAAGKALDYGCMRFDATTKTAFEELWDKLCPDAGARINVGSLDGEDIETPDK